MIAIQWLLWRACAFVLPRDTAIGWIVRLAVLATTTALLAWMTLVAWQAWATTPNPEDFSHWVNPTGGKSGSKAEYLFGPVFMGALGWCFAVKFSLSKEAAFDPLRGLRDGWQTVILVLWLGAVLGGTYFQASRALDALQRNAHHVHTA